jgi:hypothetical protein
MAQYVSEQGTAYIPDIVCGKCGKPVLDVMRLSDGRGNRWIRARCHGKEAKVGFSDKVDETVTLWDQKV